MRAYELQGGGIDGLVAVDRVRPEPGPNEVLIRVRAVSLNFRDLMVASGDYPHARPGMIPVSDGVGEVVAVGPGTKRFRPGDRVAGSFFQGWESGVLPREAESRGLGGAIDGMLAEYVVLDEDGVVAVPEHLTDEEAATLPCAGVTAWNALFVTGGVRSGDTVLVQGTGGVSIFAIQFARMAGARVLVTSSSDEKLARAEALGAHATLNYRATPDWDRWAVETTGGAGVDHVVEVGGPDTFARSLSAVRRQGEVSVIGVLTGRSGVVSTADIMWKQIRVQGVLVGSREMFEAMNRAITLHRLRPVVDRVFPFEQAREAYRYLEAAGHFGKVVVRVAAD
jgi:NADPH:quinone reductase-like Zn-dependent oxidoreductase